MWWRTMFSGTAEFNALGSSTQTILGELGMCWYPILASLEENFQMSKRVQFLQSGKVYVAYD